MKRQFLSGPYLVWMLLFTLIPLAIVVYYAFTDSLTGSFTLQNLDNGLGVEAECDRAMDYAVFWSNADVSCLEPYIPLRLAPGQTARWTLNYRFC